MNDELKTIEDRKDYFSSLNPDSAIHSFGDSSKYTAFIYSSKTKTLYCQPGNEYHSDGIEYYSNSVLKDIRNPEESGTTSFFGRFGFSDKGGGFLTIWDISDTYQKTYNRIVIGNNQEFKEMLKGMVTGEVKIKGTCPASYPISADYIVSIGGDVRSITEIVGNIVDPRHEKCKQLGFIKIKGRDVSISTLLGNFHMIRGEKLDDLVSDICTDYERVKSELETAGCDNFLAMLQELMLKVKEHGGCKIDYDSLKRKGQSRLRQQYKDVFRKGAKSLYNGNNDDPVGSEFRGNQKEIDAAWDYTQRKETFSGFKNWLLVTENYGILKPSKIRLRK